MSAEARKPSPSILPVRCLPPGALPPSGKATSPPSPRSQPHPKAFHAPGLTGPPSPGEDPGKHSWYEWCLTWVVHGAQAASWGNVSFQGPRVSSGVTLQPAAKLAGPGSRTLSAGRRKPAQWWPRETGSAEGQNSPLALLSQRHRGWPRPGEGRQGRPFRLRGPHLSPGAAGRSHPRLRPPLPALLTLRLDCALRHL